MVRHYDEHVESWLSRLNQQTMRAAALAAGLELAENSVFDAAQMVKITQKIVDQAYAEGNCVIVGRASQCVLQHRPDVFHVFVYAPLEIGFCGFGNGWRMAPISSTDSLGGWRARRSIFSNTSARTGANPPLRPDGSSCEDEDATARKIIYAMNEQVVA